MNLPHLLSISLTNLRHGGQRMIVAVLCIAFGAMSLAAMSTLADSVQRMVLIESRTVLGGDLEISWIGDEPLSDVQIGQLTALQTEGQIERFTPLADNYTLAIRTPASGEVHFLRGQGIDPESYPLLGTMELRAPDNVGLPTLLQNEGDLLITRDLADNLNLDVGDPLLLSDLTFGAPIHATVRGILRDTPDHLGDRVFYTLPTESALTGKAMPITSFFVTAPDPDVLETQLTDMGWNTFSAKQLGMDNEESRDLMNLMLKGAGILGLMVGGIGVANTMQVLLARRTREIAVFKTLGYSQGDLLTVFVLEAGMLGLLGSVLGAVAAVGVSAWLVALFGRITTFLVTWALNPITLGGSILVGVVTTLIFAMYAIIRTTDVRPAALLRNETISPAAIPWWKTTGLLLALALPFTLTTTVVLGSLWQGVAILLFALAGLVVLGGLLGGLMWLITRFLPVSRFYLLHMARNNLRRRGWSLVFAMIALFAGIVTLALAAVVTRGAGEEMDQRSFNLEGFNLLVLGTADQDTTIRAAVENQPVVQWAMGYEVNIKAVRTNGLDFEKFISPVLAGRDSLVDYKIVSGADWGTAEGVYLFNFGEIPDGSEVTVELTNGTTQTLPVIGTYEHDTSAPTFRYHSGLLMSTALLRSLTSPETVMAFVQAEPGQLEEVSAALGTALPEATTLNYDAYLTRFIQQYRNLFSFALAMAGLALLAGILLVANAVGLAMINRRYEIGVLKAVGYTRGHILTTVVMEYSLIAVIATVTGLGAVKIFLVVLGLLNNLAGEILTIGWGLAWSIGLACVGLTLVTALIAAWNPTRVAPVVVLNDRG